MGLRGGVPALAWPGEALPRSCRCAGDMAAGREAGANAGGEAAASSTARRRVACSRFSRPTPAPRGGVSGTSSLVVMVLTLSQSPTTKATASTTERQGKDGRRCVRRQPCVVLSRVRSPVPFSRAQPCVVLSLSLSLSLSLCLSLSQAPTAWRWIGSLRVALRRRPFPRFFFQIVAVKNGFHFWQSAVGSRWPRPGLRRCGWTRRRRAKGRRWPPSPQARGRPSPAPRRSDCATVLACCRYCARLLRSPAVCCARTLRSPAALACCRYCARLLRSHTALTCCARTLRSHTALACCARTLHS